ncbi:MAG TPA: Gfo/Idh/MocA family oxidoreductase [Pirellulales bacterium]|nr:Gfo/Idh/MocA family oxidoreductase [Pirellulales bacterium]
MPRRETPIGRRGLVKGSIGSALLTAASQRRVLGANERIGVGFIGFGLIGKRHVLDFSEQPDARCVAVCDAHRGRTAEGRELVGDACRGYDDFRRLLDDRDVDAVVISTPDHWHALMTMLACAAGKDVYVEKPLTLFVDEGKWMIDVARRTGRIVQVGTQQRSGLHYQRARQLIENGAIGAVHSVRMHAYRNIMPGFGAPADGPPPVELDWNLFLGPAPARPYNPQRGIYHFRWFWDYSGGQMTNLGHHSLDIVDWYLGGSLAAVSSSGGRFALEDNGETPDTQDAIFEFTRPKPNARGYTAIWSHREASAGATQPYGLEFLGTKGSLSINRKGFAITGDKRVPPQNRIPQFTGAHPIGGPRPSAERAPDDLFWTETLADASGSETEQFTRHVRNFLDCVKSRSAPVSDLVSAHRVSTMCHLANLSLRTGRKLRWDTGQETILSDPEAARLLSRPYREPWDAELRALGIG